MLGSRVGGVGRGAGAAACAGGVGVCGAPAPWDIAEWAPINASRIARLSGAVVMYQLSAVGTGMPSNCGMIAWDRS